MTSAMSDYIVKTSTILDMPSLGHGQQLPDIIVAGISDLSQPGKACMQALTHSHHDQVF